eukprot:GILK01011452.1.p1 GENE.GILK01011452.1~~GILK01011452.1.p1  ORF type:complete len:1212 (+),score=242.12 GILK01011452.1:39-3638(+)
MATVNSVFHLENNVRMPLAPTSNFSSRVTDNNRCLGRENERRDDASASRIKVVVRVRPMIPEDTELGKRIGDEQKLLCTRVHPDGSGLSIVRPFYDDREFSFDQTHGPFDSQDDAYETIAADIVDDVLQGFNGTVMAYGQTGTGKTYSTFGSARFWENSSYDKDTHRDILAMSEGRQTLHQESGIIPRAVRHIFDFIDKNCSHTQFQVTISFIQIYMEKITDLLTESAPSPTAPNSSNNNNMSGGASTKPGLHIREDPKTGVFVSGATQQIVSSQVEVLQLIREAARSRATSSTAMNKTSSRSHVILQLLVEQRSLVSEGEQAQANKENSLVGVGGKQRGDAVKAKRGLLTIVDLAGSERLSKSGSEGLRMEEAKKINKSLSALGNVIHALTDRAKHVPYRDSKLTRILQESLGGNYKTTLIVTCSPDISNVDESISSLKFAQRAKSIKNVVKVNVTRSPAQLLAIIEQLKKQLEASQAENGLLRERLLQTGQSVDSTISSQPDLIQSHLIQHASSVIMRADTSTDTEDLDRIDIESMIKLHETERTTFMSESTELRDENRILRGQVDSMSRIISQFDEKFQNTFDKLLDSYCPVDSTSEATQSDHTKSLESDRKEIEKALPISWSVSGDSTDSIDPLEMLQRQIVKTNIVNQKLKHDKLVAEWKLSLLDSKENQIAIVMKEFSSKLKELEAQIQTQEQSTVEMIPSTPSVPQATSSDVGVGSNEHSGTQRQMTFASVKVDNSTVGACEGAVSKERSTSDEWISPRALQRRAFVSVTNIHEEVSNLGSGVNILVPSSSTEIPPAGSALGSIIDHDTTSRHSIESKIVSSMSNTSSDHPHRLAVLEPLPVEEPVVAVDERFAGVAVAESTAESGSGSGGLDLAQLVSVENMKRRERDMRISFSPKGSSSAIPDAASESASEGLTNEFIPPSPPVIHKLVRRRPLLYSPPALASQASDSESSSTIPDTSTTSVAPSIRLLAASAANQSMPDLLSVTPVKQRSSRILLPVSKRAAFSLERQSSSVSRVFETGNVSTSSSQSGCSSPLNSLSNETRALRESFENRMRSELTQLRNEINSLQIQLRCSERMRSESESELNRLHKKYADMKATNKSQKKTLQKQTEQIQRLQCERDLISESAEQFHMLFEDEISKADLVMREQALQWGQLMEAVELNFWHDLDVKQTHIDSLQKQLVDLAQPKRK